MDGNEPLGEIAAPYPFDYGRPLAEAMARYNDRTFRTFNFGGTVNEGEEARLVREARHTMEMEVNRAFQRTRNRPDTYERTVALPTPNGVMFVHFNYQPNPISYEGEG